MISFTALRRASLHRLANIPGLAAPNSKPYAKLWGNSLIESQPVCHPPKMYCKSAHFFSSHKGNYSNSPIDKTIDANVSWQESTRPEWDTTNTVNTVNTTNTENKANTANTENREEKLKEQLKKELTQYLDHKFAQQRKLDKQQLEWLFASRILPELKALNSQSTQKSIYITMLLFESGDCPQTMIMLKNRHSRLKYRVKGPLGDLKGYTGELQGFSGEQFDFFDGFL